MVLHVQMKHLRTCYRAVVVVGVSVYVYVRCWVSGGPQVRQQVEEKRPESSCSRGLNDGASERDGENLDLEIPGQGTHEHGA